MARGGCGDPSTNYARTCDWSGGGSSKNFGVINGSPSNINYVMASHGFPALSTYVMNDKYTRVCSEGQGCYCRGTVKYGCWSSNYLHHTQYGSFTCNNNWGDPYSGYTKYCWCRPDQIRYCRRVYSLIGAPSQVTMVSGSTESAAYMAINRNGGFKATFTVRVSLT